MKRVAVKIVFVASIALAGNSLFAQAGKKPVTKPKPKTQTPANNPYATPKDTTKPAPVDVTNPYANPGANGVSNANTGSKTDTIKKPKSNLPYFQMPSSGGGLFDTVKPSLRTDDAVGRIYVRDRTPLAYDYIREDDAVYKQRIWREIDIREKLNQVFGYAADEDNGNQRLISILVNAIRNKDVVAFDASDDRFTTPLTVAEVMKTFGGGIDTFPKLDIDGNKVGYEIRARTIQPDSIYKFRVKEDVIFDKEASRMVVRILGIAPMMKQYASNGQPITEDLVPLFWIYYPDLRPTLAKYQVYNPKNSGARMSWEDLFANRMFSSYITKKSDNNFRDIRLKDYINDPLFRLLEGEKIKEKIFNYEQNLWQY